MGAEPHSASELVESILQLTGWTQVRLVHEVRRTARLLGEAAPAGLDVVTVNRWRRGRQNASGYYLRLLRHLWEAARRQALADGDLRPVRRRQFLAQLALAGVGVLDVERIEHVVQARGAVDATLVAGLDLLTQSLGRQWHSTPPVPLLGAVKQYLALLNELRLSHPSPTLERDVRRVSARTAALAGWLTWLTGDRTTAEAFYALAHGVAAEAGDGETAGFVLVARSFLYSPLFRAAAVPRAPSVALLDRAVEVTRRTASPLLRVFALARHAEEHAATGGAGAATTVRRDLDLMEHTFDTVRGRDGGFFSYWDRERIAGIRGTCAVLLGETGEAISILTPALAGTPSELAAERSILATDLAAAHARRGDVERVCELLTHSLSVGLAGDVNRLDRILDVRETHLERWADTPAVRELDDRLRARVGLPWGEQPGR